MRSLAKIILKEISISVFKELKKIGKPIEARELASKLNIEYEILMNQAVYELQQKSLAEFTEEKVTELTPTDEFKEYIKNGLPERQLFNILKNIGKECLIEELKSKSKMDQQMFFIGLSYMKKNQWVRESKAVEKPTIFIYNDNAPESSTEKITSIFKKSNQIVLEDLSKEYIEEVDTLVKRKLIKKNAYTRRIITLTKKGLSTDEGSIEIQSSYISNLTAEMLADGSWKECINNLKPFEVENKSIRLQAGKLHPMTILLNQIREIFLSMGFIEIKGPIVELAFYNFDSLYQPQDHPARELHDTFYLKNPAKGRLPDKKWVDAVKITHETGETCGSKGWGYKWNEEIAKRTLLRTHTTATTIRRLSKVVQDHDKLPLKVFSIDRVFRNENLDATHLAEFMQVEGIVIGENVNLTHLRGILTEFYKKMGFPKIITRPGFFPYTEPSMEISVYSEQLGRWLEMGGSGIFRPEVCAPWGINEPMRVLAWGQGFERLAMLRLGRKDIRDLYRSPLSWLREVEYSKEE